MADLCNNGQEAYADNNSEKVKQSAGINILLSEVISMQRWI